MRSAERSDELAASLGGFYSCWVAYLGLELGLFERIQAAIQMWPRSFSMRAGPSNWAGRS